MSITSGEETGLLFRTGCMPTQVYYSEKVAFSFYRSTLQVYARFGTHLLDHGRSDPSIVAKGRGLWEIRGAEKELLSDTAKRNPKTKKD